MKLTLLITLAIICSVQSMAQYEQLPTREIEPPRAAFYNGIESKQSTDILKAGGDLIWQDDFSNPANWTIATSGQGTFILGDNTHPEMVSNAGYLGNMASTTASNGFAFFNGSQYLDAENVDPQNTTVTSHPLDLSLFGLVIVTFEQRYRAFSFDQTFVELSYDGGATWTYSEEVNVWAPANGSTLQNMVTLYVPTPGSANTVLRFRWLNTSSDDFSGSGYGWCIDDVEIREGYGNDVANNKVVSLMGTNPHVITKMPVSQAASAGNISFESFFTNHGSNTLPVEMNVAGSGYNFTTAPVTVVSLASDSLEINAANGMPVPLVVGPAGINVTLTSGAGLSNIQDDALPVLFEVTDNLYAADAFDGNATSIDGKFESWAGGNPNPAIGTVFEIFETIEVGKLGIGIASIPLSNQANYIGHEFKGLVYLFNPGSGQFEYYTETETMVLSAQHFASVVDLNLNNVTFNAGDLYLVMASSFSLNRVPFAFSGSLPNGSVYGLDDGTLIMQANPTYPNLLKAPVVRLNSERCAAYDTLTINTCVSYTSPSGSQTWTVSGIYNDTIFLSGSCDSIFLINLTIANQQGPSVVTYCQPSDANMCVGTLVVDIDGFPDFTCDIDGGAPFTNSGYQLIEDLCPGIHTLTSTDFCGISAVSTVVIPVDSNYVFNNPFIDSIAVDSIGSTIEDCDIYYNGIDTAFIDSIFANGNEVTVIWNIVDSNGSNFDTSSYVLNNGNGVYYLQLSVFCPNRAVGEYFAVSEAIYFDNGSVSTAGINDKEQLPWVEIFPNPTSGLVTIHTGSTSTKLEVVDAQGRIVLTEVGFQQKTISLETFRAGIYFFHLSSDKGTLVARVLKR